LKRFVEGRVLFAGDSAHVVSPFGARGGNGGVQDVDNLCWKLARVLRGEAPAELVASYDRERVHGADENILNSSRTTAFMTPKTAVERQLRDGVLALAADFPFARGLVNSGRLSKPCHLQGFAGFAADDGSVAGPMRPGVPCDDAPVTGVDGRATWLLNHLGGRPTALVFVADRRDAAAIERTIAACGIADLAVVALTDRPCGDLPLPELVDREGLTRARYGGRTGVTYLIRPDQHVLGRWGEWNPAALGAAWRLCLGGGKA